MQVAFGMEIPNRDLRIFPLVYSPGVAYDTLKIITIISPGFFPDKIVCVKKKTRYV